MQQSGTPRVGDRRRFLTTAGAVGVGLTATQLLVRTATAAVKSSGKSAAKSSGLSPAAKPGTSGVSYAQARRDFPGIPGRSVDEIVLNFALTLEILEADLYRQALNAASGRSLGTALNPGRANYSNRIAAGGLTGGTRNAAFAYLNQFAFVEATHRDFLTSAIKAAGGTPTTRNPAGYQFPGGSPGSTLREILANILPLEETGVRAYLGALPYLTNVGYQTTAASIYSTEARHSAAIRQVLGQDAGPAPMKGDLSVAKELIPNEFEYALAPATVIQAAGAYFISA